MIGQHVWTVDLRLGQRIALGREPARALPAIDGAENRTQLLHAVIDRRALQGPGGRALLVRVMRREDVGIGFLVLGLEVAPRRVGAETTGIDTHHIDRGFTLDDPLGELPARATRCCDAEGMSFVQPEVPPVPGGADDRRTVGRIGDGAVIDLLDAHLAKGWHARDRGFNVRGEPVEVFLEELVFALVRRAVHVAAGCPMLVRPKQQATVFLTHVPGGIRLAQNAHFGHALGLALLDERMGLGHDVLVLDGNHRNIEANHRARLARKVAGGGNDVLAGDVALVGLHHPLAVRLLLDAGDGGVAVDLSTARARTLRHGLGEIGRLDIAVIGVLDRAEQAIGLAERPDLLDLLRGEDVDLDADRLGNPGVVHELIPAVLGAGEADVGDLLEAHMLAGLGLEGIIELDRVLVDLAHRVGQVEQRQQACSMPGRTGGQLLPLDQDHVAPAFPGQMVERTDADHAASDDDHARMCFHVGKSLKEPR